MSKTQIKKRDRGSRKRAAPVILASWYSDHVQSPPTSDRASLNSEQDVQKGWSVPSKGKS